MQRHDEPEALAHRRATKNSQPADAGADVGTALANPRTASVQAMLEVQRLAGNAGVNQLLAREEDPASGGRSPVLDVVGKGGGQALDSGLRGEMEGRLGADFSDVRVHNDSKASESAKSVAANAYTVGNEVVVRNDRWSPSTQTGKETIAHELTHVVQQRNGPVAGTSTGDGISVSDPGDRFERAAESNAARAMAAPAPAGGTAGASAQLEADHRMQREAAPEEEEVQGQFVQREAAPEEEEVQGQFVQREAAPEEEEVQGQFVQREEEEQEEPVQGQFVQRAEEEPEEKGIIMQ